MIYGNILNFNKLETKFNLVYSCELEKLLNKNSFDFQFYTDFCAQFENRVVFMLNDIEQYSAEYTLDNALTSLNLTNNSCIYYCFQNLSTKITHLFGEDYSLSWVFFIGTKDIDNLLKSIITFNKLKVFI